MYCLGVSVSLLFFYASGKYQVSQVCFRFASGVFYVVLVVHWWIYVLLRSICVLIEVSFFWYGFVSSVFQVCFRCVPCVIRRTLMLLCFVQSFMCPY